MVFHYWDYTFHHCDRNCLCTLQLIEKRTKINQKSFQFISPWHLKSRTFSQASLLLLLKLPGWKKASLTLASFDKISGTKTTVDSVLAHVFFGSTEPFSYFTLYFVWWTLAVGTVFTPWAGVVKVTSTKTTRLC